MKVIKNCCFMTGTALLAAALFLVLHNLHEDQICGEQAEAVLSVLQKEIPADVPETAELAETYPYDMPLSVYESSIYETAAEPEMETAEVDGNPYIGIIYIPELNLTLPVMGNWSDAGLKTAPCRYQGNVYTDDLIIAGHNYTSHFGKISRLSVGSEILFTDMSGRKHVFRVCEKEQLSGTAIEQMTGGSDESWDLTLFTCTLNGQNRVTVRAERVLPSA